ncbi:hypothetical protein MTR_6g453110 [Medicago truncatula]|uniref:RNA recognition motif n=1 Tax=Medicago truncatula TaxID=3880 RepID=A0A072UKJ1_MEDTR|nr:hypothetical protein MTR_6g453110 [Medicago truncatula]
MATNNLDLGFRQTDLRPPREDLVRRREAFDGDQHRSRGADVAHGKAAHVSTDKETNQTELSQYKRFVTFYFTNFLPQLSIIYLRKGFEVCGLLEEVVVPSRRNANEEVYGFVRFSKVMDVSKLLKALNAVCFGSFRVREKVARFDRCVANEGKLMRDGEGVRAVGKASGGRGVSVVEKKAGEGGNIVVLKDVGKKHVDEGEKMVRVGEVVVLVREGKEKFGQRCGGHVANVVREVGKATVPVVEKEQPVAKKLVHMYKSNRNDLKFVTR